MTRIFLAVAAALSIAACDGPHEQAGEKADVASGAVKKGDAITSGPAETLGEKQDRAEAAQKRAREAAADALEDQADAARKVAEEKAAELDQKADQVRAGK